MLRVGGILELDFLHLRLGGLGYAIRPEDEIAYVIYDKDGDIVFVSPDKQEAQDKIKEYSKANKFAKFRIKEEPLSDYEK